MRTLAPALLLLLLAAAVHADPRRCGDDVGGHRVPCDCGDVLVSSHTLGPDDPITSRVCPGTGLLVDVPPERPATLAFADAGLKGSGHGYGLQVRSGGDGGLKVSGPGTIQGFDIGVFAPTGGLAGAAELTVSDSRSDGFNVGADGTVLTGCTAGSNGRDGFALRGMGYRLEGNRALGNGRYGFVLRGRDGTVGDTSRNEATGNGRSGFQVSGRGHDVQGPVATANGGAGIRAHVAAGRIRGAVTTANGGAGLRAVGHDLDLAGNEARGNGGGIQMRGARVRDGGGNRAEDCRGGGACR